MPSGRAYLFTLADISNESLDGILLLVKLHRQAVNLLQVLCALRLQAIAKLRLWTVYAKLPYGWPPSGHHCDMSQLWQRSKLQYVEARPHPQQGKSRAHLCQYALNFPVPMVYLLSQDLYNILLYKPVSRVPLTEDWIHSNIQDTCVLLVVF